MVEEFLAAEELILNYINLRGVVRHPVLHILAVEKLFSTFVYYKICVNDILSILVQR